MNILTKSSTLEQTFGLPERAMFAALSEPDIYGIPNHEFHKISDMKSDNIKWDCPDLTPNERARMIIEARDLKWVDIARDVGVSDVAARKWVMHAKTFNWSQICAYAKAIGVESAWLLTGFELFSTSDGEELVKGLGKKSHETIKLMIASMRESQSH